MFQYLRNLYQDYHSRFLFWVSYSPGEMFVTENGKRVHFEHYSILNDIVNVSVNTSSWFTEKETMTRFEWELDHDIYIQSLYN